MFNFIIWDIDPDIIDLGFPRIRYYGLMFVFAFMLGFTIMRKVFKKEGTNENWLDSLLWYMMGATLIGARLGHCLFYEPDYYLSHPLEILKVWEGGLASHGAAFGILLGLYLWSRRVAKRNMLWVLDRIVIVVALGSFFIRMGNFFNSEIYGRATKSESGIVYFRDTQIMHSFDSNEEYQKYFEKIKLKKAEGEPIEAGKAYPVEVHFWMTKNVKDQQTADAVINYRIFPALKYKVNSEGSESNVYISSNEAANPQISKERGKYKVVVSAYAIPKHPSQLYEAFSYLALFIFLYFAYFYKGISNRPGMMIGVLLTGTFIARWIIEYVKENQVSGEMDMAFNLGQMLSIPFILAGIALIVWAATGKSKRFLVEEATK